MIKKNFYWFFDKALSKATCQKIIKHGEARKLKMGSIENIGSEKRATKKERKYVEKFRKSKLCFMNDKWLYDLFSPYINTANKNAGWGYDLTWSESFQYTVYKKIIFIIGIKILLMHLLLLKILTLMAKLEKYL